VDVWVSRSATTETESGVCNVELRCAGLPAALCLLLNTFALSWDDYNARAACGAGEAAAAAGSLQAILAILLPARRKLK